MAAWRRPVEAFRKWWSRQSASERWRIAATLVALALLLLVIAFALWRTTALTALFLAPVAVGLVVLGLLGPNAREWLIEHVIPIGALLLSGWLLGAFGLWAVVNTVWAGQAQHPAQDHALLTVAGVPLTAAAQYPGVALADAADDVLTLSFSAGAAPLPRQVVTATVTLPDTLAFATAGGPPTRDFLVPLTAGQPGSRRIGIVNNGVYGGWRGRKETIAVRLCAGKDNCTTDDLSLTVRPEGRDGYAIRRFVNSTIDEASPLVWVALLLLPAVAVLAQRLVDDRKRRRAEEIDLGWTRFQEYFMSEGAPAPGSPSGKEKAAQHELAVLKTLERREPMAGRYVDVGQAFLDFADGYGHLAPPPSTATEQRPTEEDRRVLEMNGRWPELFAGAYLHLHRGIHLYYEKHQRGPEKALLEHYSDARLRLQYAALEARPDVRDQLAVAFAVDSKRLAYPIQALVWPQPRVDEPDGRRFGPFRQGDATDPGEALFLRGGFYGRHPLFNRDLRPLGRPTTDSHLVTGSSGCGRSAFAAALTGRPHADEITVGLRGRPNPRDMWVGVARQLTDFVLTHPTHAHPTHLEKMGRARITALAALLIETRGYATAAATVEHVQANLDNLHGLGTFDRRGKAGLLLQLLARALADEEARRDRAAAVPAHDRWGRDGPDGYLLECLAALGFNRVTFVLDLPLSGGVGGWVSSHVFDRLEEWRGASARFIIFAPQAIAADVARPPSLIRKHKLSWTEKQLREMIDTRYAYALGRYRHAAERFADSAGLTTLIEHSKVGTDDNSYNPRRFIRLWQAATKELGADDPISQAHIAAAVREVKG